MNTAKVYYDIDGNKKTIFQMVRDEPTWAAVRIQEGEKAIEKVKELEAERDRFIKETYRLRSVLDQIKGICRNCPSEDLEQCGNCVGHTMASIADLQRFRITPATISQRKTDRKEDCWTPEGSPSFWPV